MAVRIFKKHLPSLVLLLALCLGVRAIAAPSKVKKAPVKPTPAKKVSAATKKRELPPKRTESSPTPVAAKVSAPWTRTVRVTDAYAGTYYADTLAVVVDSQFLIVPWTFISEVWLNRPGARLLADGVKRDLMLVDVDLTSNLALLKSAEVVLPTLNRGSIRMDLPRQDEALMVMSARDSLRPGAHFVQAKGDGVSLRYQIAMNAGDSSNVRYIFDRAGQLVAVASVFEGGEAKWAAPSRAVYDLLRRQDGPKPASTNAPYQRRTQLYYSQRRWTDSLLPAPNAVSLQGLDCRTHLTSIAERDLAGQIKTMHSLDCEGRFPLPVVGTYSAGMNISMGDAVLRSVDAENGRKLLRAVAQEAFSDQEKTASFVNLMTVPECRDETIANPGGGQLLVRFCTSGLKFEPGLGDTAIAVSSLDTSARAHYAVARLKGFDQENTRKVLKALIENVRSKR